MVVVTTVMAMVSIATMVFCDLAPTSGSYLKFENYPAVLLGTSHSKAPVGAQCGPLTQ